MRAKEGKFNWTEPNKNQKKKKHTNSINWYKRKAKAHSWYILEPKTFVVKSFFLHCFLSLSACLELVSCRFSSVRIDNKIIRYNIDRKKGSMTNSRNAHVRNDYDRENNIAMVLIASKFVFLCVLHSSIPFASIKGWQVEKYASIVSLRIKLRT